MTSLLRNVDREGWGSGVTNPPPFGRRQGSRRYNRRLPLSVTEGDKCNNPFKDCGYIDSDPDYYPVGHNMPFPVYGAANLEGLRSRGLLGVLPLLQAYRRGVRYHGFLTPQPIVNGPFWLPRRGVRGLPVVSHGPSKSWIPQLSVAFKSFQIPYGRFTGVYGDPSRLSVARMVRPVTALNRPISNSLSVGSSPRGPYRRREGFGSRASYLPHYRDNQNRNVSHLNLLSGSAPTPLVRVNPGREFFGNARKVIRKFRKNV